jgi:hypothetical protein
VPLRSGVIDGERERRNVWAPDFRILLYLYSYGNLTIVTGDLQPLRGRMEANPTAADPQPPSGCSSDFMVQCARARYRPF